jgi:hypothetical protein
MKVSADLARQSLPTGWTETGMPARAALARSGTPVGGEVLPAQLEGGILGGKAYLAAYALGCGATGLTFLDDEVKDFFLPDASGKAVMFLIAVGRSAARAGRVRR